MADLVDGERPGGDLSDEDLIDDFHRGRIGQSTDYDLAAFLEADITDQVNSSLFDGWHGKKPARGAAKLNGIQQAGAHELGGYFGPLRQQGEQPRWCGAGAGKTHGDIDARGGVARHDLRLGFGTDPKPEKQEVELRQVFVDARSGKYGGAHQECAEEQKDNLKYELPTRESSSSPFAVNL